jgi:hypothetical protein
LAIAARLSALYLLLVLTVRQFGAQDPLAMRSFIAFSFAVLFFDETLSPRQSLMIARFISKGTEGEKEHTRAKWSKKKNGNSFYTQNEHMSWGCLHTHSLSRKNTE